MHSDTLSSERRRMICGEYQLGWRNSMLYRLFGESMRRNAERRSASALKLGGNWKRIEAALSPSNDKRLSINSRLFTEFADRRFQCVINFDAFHVKTKFLPVCSFQLLTAFGVGVR